MSSIVELPAWFDITAQFGFFNLEGYNKLCEKLHNKNSNFWIFGKEPSNNRKRFSWANFRTAILEKYEVSGNLKAILLLDAMWTLETSGGEYDEYAAERALAAFDYTFGNLYERIIS